MAHFGTAQEMPELRIPRIRPIYVMCEEGLQNFQIQAVLQAIQTVLQIALVSSKIQVINFGIWRNRDYRDGSLFRPYHSIDWYIQSARQASDRHGQLNGDQLIDNLRSEPWQNSKPHYDIVILHSDLYSGKDDNNFVIGLAAQGLGTVISINRFLRIDQTLQIECIKTETIHEVAHVFGLIPDERNCCVEESLNKHCTNVCVMRQGLTVPNDWISMTYDRLRVGQPFCPFCLQDLQRYFED